MRQNQGGAGATAPCLRGAMGHLCHLLSGTTAGDPQKWKSPGKTHPWFLARSEHGGGDPGLGIVTTASSLSPHHHHHHHHSIVIVTTALSLSPHHRHHSIVTTASPSSPQHCHRHHTIVTVTTALSHREEGTRSDGKGGARGEATTTTRRESIPQPPEMFQPLHRAPEALRCPSKPHPGPRQCHPPRPQPRPRLALTVRPPPATSCRDPGRSRPVPRPRSACPC